MPDRGELQRDLRRYPRTGRFLFGRMRGAMTAGEKQLIEDLIEREESFEAGDLIARRGVEYPLSTMLIEGFAIRVIQRGGKAHIVGLQMPGDFVDLIGFALKRLDHDIYSLGPTRTARVRHSRLRQVLADQPHLARLLWFSTLLDAAIHREWILKLEDLNAAQRASHVFCELWSRLEMVGLAGDDGFSIPLTQIQLSAMCGATPVHMSRAMRLLREKNLATFRNGVLHCPDRAALERFCDYNPAYLYGAGDLHMADDDYADDED